ncbi:helix-turn-helix transcriptional regulator [Streptomyces sp. SCUT-3]|uniref:helix-turn-helix domain-containing protein n=1 Tax=Streptomyces sp. SCUT-3 TaxID=2684469 RepID=UPI0021754FE1|nr:helix-turn-helix transcriptional regulator [Streptomyces sp. SCUT-3]
MRDHDGRSVGLAIFGMQSRALRERLGMTQAELAGHIGYSESLVRMVERGERKPRPDYVERVDKALRAQGVLIAATPFLRQDRYPPWFIEYVETEANAVSLYKYDTHVVPGLLQTEEYARAVFSAHCPALDDEEVESSVLARLERQVLLTRKPAPTVGFVVEEWVLRRPIGGKGVLKSQLHRLLKCMAMRNVTIQVMPMGCEAHAGFDGPMTLLETPEARRLGYVEGQGVSTFVTKETEVSVLERRYGIIRTQALTTEDSARLIECLAGEL